MTVTGLIGVYDADGDLRGELAYLWGKARGVRHCGLCDITHGPLRRKQEWDRFAAGLGVPFDLLHLNERPAEVVAAMAGMTAPVVFAVDAGGRLDVVMDAVRLAECGGSVAGFAEQLAEELRRRTESGPVGR